MNTVKIRGNRLSYVDLHSQNEEVILLVHGHPFDHSMWEYQYDALKDFRIINPDLFGYGQSESGFEKIFIEQQALDLVLLLDQLGIQQVHLMGLSMGGEIIVEFTRLFPHRVRSLVVCASTPHAENEITFAKRMANAEQIAQIGMLEHTRLSIPNYINTKVHPEGSEVYQHLFKMMSQTRDQGAIASHRGRAERRDNFAFLKMIQLPTLFIAGEKDYFFEPSVIEKAAEQVPGAQLQVIEHSGHLPNMEQPLEFNQYLVSFYRELMAS